MIPEQRTGVEDKCCAISKMFFSSPGGSPGRADSQTQFVLKKKAARRIAGATASGDHL
jgi:hypothetical protein